LVKLLTSLYDDHRDGEELYLKFQDTDQDMEELHRDFLKQLQNILTEE
jgi:hypothetical protein